MKIIFYSSSTVHFRHVLHESFPVENQILSGVSSANKIDSLLRLSRIVRRKITHFQNFNFVRQKLEIWKICIKAYLWKIKFQVGSLQRKKWIRRFVHAELAYEKSRISKMGYNLDLNHRATRISTAEILGQKLYTKLPPPLYFFMYQGGT